MYVCVYKHFALILYVWVLCSLLCLCTVARTVCRSDKMVKNYPGAKIWMAVSPELSVRNWTWVFWKRNQCSYLLGHLSFLSMLEYWLSWFAPDPEMLRVSECTASFSHPQPPSLTILLLLLLRWTLNRDKDSNLHSTFLDYESCGSKSKLLWSVPTWFFLVTWLLCQQQRFTMEFWWANKNNFIIGESPPSTSEQQVQRTYPKPETGLRMWQLMASWRRIFPCVF